jgi:hypothetical protein
LKISSLRRARARMAFLLAAATSVIDWRDGSPSSYLAFAPVMAYRLIVSASAAAWRAQLLTVCTEKRAPMVI